MERACEDVKRESEISRDDCEVDDGCRQIQTEIMAEQADLLSLIPDVKTLQIEMKLLRRHLWHHRLKQHPQISHLQHQSNILDATLTGMASDLTGMDIDICMMLGTKANNEGPQSVIHETGYLRSIEDPEEQGDVELGIHEYNYMEQYRAGEGIKIPTILEPELHDSCANKETRNEAAREIKHRVGAILSTLNYSVSKGVRKSNNLYSPHNVKVKENRKKSFPCKYCGTVFHNFRVLCRHKAMHREMGFQCTDCGKVLKTERILKIHKLELHSSEKPFMCHVCGSTFKRLSSLVKCKHRVGLLGTVQAEKHAARGQAEPLLAGGQAEAQVGGEYVEARVGGRQASESISYPFRQCAKIFSDFIKLKAHTEGLCNNIADPLEKPFKCETCEKAFTKRSLLNAHMKLHGKKSYSCEVCGKSFPTGRDLNRHRKSHLPHNTYGCDYCLRIFKSQKSLEIHINVHIGQKPYECEICHEAFPSLSAKKNHRFRTHLKGHQGYGCAICGKVFKSTFVRETHYMQHTEEELVHHNIVIKMVKCDDCGKILRKDYYKRHLNIHSKSNEQSFIREIRGKSLKCPSRFRQHVDTHSKVKDKKLHTCKFCGKEYRSSFHLKLHMKLHPEASTPGFQFYCDLCGKAFAFRSMLVCHIQSHTRETTRLCGICGRTFRLKSQLELHKKVHTGDEPFTCSICGKGFLYRHSLQCHELSHTEVKAFKCEICGKAFSQLKNMQRHTTCHSGKKPFQCDFCDKKFALKVTMQIHRRIHTGEKPYQCNICGQQFADPSAACKHKARHTNEIAEMYKIDASFIN